MLCALLAILVSGGQDQPLSVIPLPDRAFNRAGKFSMDDGSRVIGAGQLEGLAAVIAKDVSTLTGLSVSVSQKTSVSVDLVLTLTEGGEEGYSITMRQDVEVRGGSIAALAQGASTFLQLLDGAEFDRIEIHDRPAVGFRALMVDVARNYHSVETLEKLIEVCRFSKVRFMQLHLTDDQNWMFPSDVLGDLSSHNSHGKPSYTKAEILGLNQYARLRGVELIPEIDVPGHSSILVRAKPELFKIENTNLGGCIDFASAESRSTVRALLNEVAALFPNSRYIHFGGDEAYYAGAEKDPDFIDGLKRLGYESEGRYLGELFRDFLANVSRHIISLGKTPIVWEGFGSAPNSKVKLPDELVVVSWNGAYHPQRMIDDGLTIINACWDPCYVVDHYPRDNFTYAAPARMYQFDVLRFQTYFRGFPISDGVTLGSNKSVIGGMVCWWEGREENAVRLLAERMAAFGARLWSPELETDWTSFSLRYKGWSQTLEKIIGAIPVLVRDGEVAHALTTNADVTTDADVYPNHPVSLVTDGRVGDRLDYWMAYPTPASLTIDMGVVEQVSRLVVLSFWDGRAVSRYKLSVSVDGVEWEEISDMSGNEAVATKDGNEHVFGERGVRYIRFESFGNTKVPGTFARVVEIQAFGPD